MTAAIHEEYLRRIEGIFNAKKQISAGQETPTRPQPQGGQHFSPKLSGTN